MIAMAEQELVEQLKHRIDEWKQRRQLHDFRPDLSGIDLHGADFNGANLSNANLSRTILTRADFYESNLSNTNLTITNLVKANLVKADLHGADLVEADLTGVGLHETDLTGVRFGLTTFAWLDLTCIKGLETAIHVSPSTVNINSVKLPQDEMICKHFLRGVGFTETQIEYLPSLLTSRPIQYHSLFISYAHQDEAVAKQLHKDLRKNDVPCWFAPHDMRIGDKIRYRIDESIRLHNKLLLILSEHSVASSWVEHEVETALSNEYEGKTNVLFPIRLDDAVMKSMTGWASHVRLTRHIGDFTNWQDDTAYQRDFEKLLRDLKVNRQPIK
jgi:hypothetical protein